VGPRARRSLKVAAVFVALLLAAALLVAWPHRDFLLHRVGVVRPGVLYRSAQLDPDDLDELVGRYGIRTVVNVREVVPAGEAEAVRARGLAYAWIPTPTQVPPPETVERFLALLDDPARLPILLHCEHGVGRTGVLTAIYRMEHEGWSADEAIAEARRYAMGGSFEEGQDKTEFLRRYLPRRTRPPAPDAP